MIDKIDFLVRESIRGLKDEIAIIVMDNSIMSYDENNYGRMHSYFMNYKVDIKVLPTIYTKYINHIHRITALYEHYFSINSPDDISISSVIIKPDYDKLAIINTKIEVVVTEWDRINERQKKLIESRKTSTDSMDYQSIGLIARSLMEDLAEQVFVQNIHIAPEGVPTTKDKYKNRLHTYIKHELKGKNNLEYIKFLESSIEFTERGIDLMNTTTHKLNAQMHFADACILSSINVVSLVKSIFDKDLS